MMHASWLKEFKAEIEDDRRQLEATRSRRAGGAWSHGKALERTKAYYRQRIQGFADSGTITEKERDRLLALVEGLGSPPADL